MALMWCWGRGVALAGCWAGFFWLVCFPFFCFPYSFFSSFFFSFFFSSFLLSLSFFFTRELSRFACCRGNDPVAESQLRLPPSHVTLTLPFQAWIPGEPTFQAHRLTPEIGPRRGPRAHTHARTPPPHRAHWAVHSIGSSIRYARTRRLKPRLAHRRHTATGAWPRQTPYLFNSIYCYCRYRRNTLYILGPPPAPPSSFCQLLGLGLALQAAARRRQSG